ncbi:hypothetical protein [Streptomyces sp. NPDC060194]|uniref:hypothetical protein n=1 Tax=Streptomyces sp. NPDC060194 TaxID=3347069 RepID=UPI00365360D7
MGQRNFLGYWAHVRIKGESYPLPADRARAMHYAFWAAWVVIVVFSSAFVLNLVDHGPRYWLSWLQLGAALFNVPNAVIQSRRRRKHRAALAAGAQPRS